MITNKNKKELLRFLIAGFSAVGMDLMSYNLLLSFLNYNFAKGISFLLGTAVAFLINKYWTFEKYKKSYVEILKFCLLYSLTLIINIVTNHYVLISLDLVFLAFLIATGTSTVINFLGQKFWVFK